MPRPPAIVRHEPRGDTGASPRQLVEPRLQAVLDVVARGVEALFEAGGEGVYEAGGHHAGEHFAQAALRLHPHRAPGCVAQLRREVDGALEVAQLIDEAEVLALASGVDL